MSGQIKMALGPNKKALKDKIAIDYSKYDLSQCISLKKKIETSYDRLKELQSDLCEKEEDNSALIEENEILIETVGDHLSDLSTRIYQLTTPTEPMSDTSIAKITEILEKLSTPTSDPSSNILNEPMKKLAEAVEKISQPNPSSHDQLASVLKEMTDRLAVKEDGSTNIESRSKSLLPKLYIKKFYGNILEWPSFYDSFKAAITSQNFSNVEKFNYLKSLLRGQAQAAINGLPMTDDSYAKGVQTLETLYGNPQLIISAASKSLREIKSCDRNPANLRKTYNEIENLLSTMELAGESTDNTAFITLLLEKFPIEVTLEIQKKILKEKITMKQVREFLSTEILARQQTSYMKHAKTSHSQYTSESLLSVEHKKCIYCKGPHYSDECKKYHTVEERLKVLGDKSCILCLRKNHTISNCRIRRTCVHCRAFRKHHRSLCPSRSTPKESKSSTTGTPSSTVNNPETACLAHDERTIMITALAYIVNGDKKIKTRIMIDNGASRTYISKKIANLLDLRNQGRIEVPVRTFNDTSIRNVKMNQVDFAVESKNGSLLHIKGNSVETIASNLYPKAYDISQFDSQKSYEDIPIVENDGDMEVQVLVGGDYEMDFLLSGVIKLTGNVYLRNTILGWVFAGREKINTFMSEPITSLMAIESTSEQVTIRDITQFYELENIGIMDDPSEKDEEKVLEHFYDALNIRDNRYFVSFPWNEFPPPIPTNYGLAQGRLKSLIRQLHSNPAIFQSYHEQIMENLRIGIIERVPNAEYYNVNSHYIPHHGILREHKSLRIVYDASAKTKGNPSVNECMHRGPLLLENLCSLLINFRFHRIALLADIQRAFLELGLNEPDRDYVRFLWVESPQNTTAPPIVYRFARVPFGTISSPFLLNAVVNTHIENSNSPVKDKLTKHFYVDNLITGCSDKSEAIEIYSEAKKLFSSAAMNLRQWTTNCQDVYDKIPENDRLPTPENTCSVLGLLWDRITDTISLKKNTDIEENRKCTKRNVLAILGSNFDPCGYFLPFVINIKLIMQKMWTHTSSWDDIAIDLQSEWEDILDSFLDIYKLYIPRFIDVYNSSDVQLHCFVDASQNLFATAIYLRLTKEVHNISAHLLFAKSRVSSLSKKRTITIPRMELLGATLGAQLIRFIQKHCPFPFQRIILWTDSQCVIDWYHSKKILPTFVRNRIQNIKKISPLEIRHVPSASNPADFLTKNFAHEEIDDKWWYGPEWLKKMETCWPENTSPTPLIEPEEEYPNDHTRDQMLSAVESNTNNPPFGLKIEHFSNIAKLWRVTAYCNKFFCKNKGSLTASDIRQAQILWISYIQHQHFADTFKKIRSSKRDNLQQNFSLFIDKEDGILRCGSRFVNQHPTTNYPILLPKNNIYTEKLILFYHKILLHSRVTHTLCMLRKTYWIPQGRQVIRRILRPCVVCQKVQGTAYAYPPMPPLPDCRIQNSCPFQYTGLDYFGPLSYITHTDEVFKAYGILFTCFTTRATHLELVPEMSLHHFSLAIQRFANRRGKPQAFYSDNASQIKAFQEMHTDFQWNYITPFSPWQGGIYERVVGLTKTYLKKALGKRLVPYEELHTIFTHIEAILNTRPLCYINSSDTSEIILTPATLLNTPNLGDLSNLPSHILSTSYQSIVKNDLVRLYKNQQHILNSFWQAWRGSYLQTLKERFRKPTTIRSRHLIPQVGDLVQLSSNEKPRISWKIGKITQLKYSRDGNIRSAQIKLANNKCLVRPISSLYPLEIHE